MDLQLPDPDYKTTVFPVFREIKKIEKACKEEGSINGPGNASQGEEPETHLLCAPVERERMEER